jgi:hypothetical protein
MTRILNLKPPGWAAPVIYLFFGVVLLVLGLWGLNAFATADPAKLLRFARQVALLAGATVAVLLLAILLASRRFGFALLEVAAIALLVRWAWPRWRRGWAWPGSPATPVETPYIRMHFDHASGTMSGMVQRGKFQGRDLAKLSRDQLLALWRECCTEDEPGAAMLEAYLDREIPDWCQTRPDDAGQAIARAGDAMTTEEALAVLGLSAGAGKAEIRAAHRRLMAKLGLENGDSAHLAAKLNQAQEILLRG